MSARIAHESTKPSTLRRRATTDRIRVSLDLWQARYQTSFAAAGAPAFFTRRCRSIGEPVASAIPQGREGAQRFEVLLLGW
jgi:hypothetical protein